MKQLEFDEVMTVAGTNNSSSTRTDSTSSDVDGWDIPTFYFSGTLYEEQIPGTVANIICEKKLNHPFEIRVDGGGDDFVPSDYATEGLLIFLNEMKDYCFREINVEETEAMKVTDTNNSSSTRTNSASSDVDDCDDLSIYFSGTYDVKVGRLVPYAVADVICKKEPNYPFEIRVDVADDDFVLSDHATEGLLVFLNEMKDYYLRKSNTEETEMSKYDETMARVCSEMLKEINPSISAYDWMQDDEENKDKYNSAVERDSKTKLGQMLRTAILDFDQAVNPFTKDDIELDEIGNYLRKVAIAGDTEAIGYNYKDRKGCCFLRIADINTGNETTGNETIYHRDPEGFLFGLKYMLDDKQYFVVQHGFATTADVPNRGEIIEINYWGDNLENEIDLILNLTNGKIGERYGDRTSATPEQIEFVYNELLKATSYASKITVENMEKKPATKQRVISKDQIKK